MTLPSNFPVTGGCLLRSNLMKETQEISETLVFGSTLTELSPRSFSTEYLPLEHEVLH
jgi:hypothetical protein